MLMFLFLKCTSWTSFSGDIFTFSFHFLFTCMCCPLTVQKRAALLYQTCLVTWVLLYNIPRHLKLCCEMNGGETLCLQKCIVWAFSTRMTNSENVAQARSLFIPLLPFHFVPPKRKFFRQKGSVSHTLWFMKHDIIYLSTIPPVLPVSLSPPLFLFFSTQLTFLAPSPPPTLAHSASAPPYNHAGSWLSFGAVYIAIIVRVQ